MRADSRLERLFDATAEEWCLPRAGDLGWLDADTGDPEYAGYCAYSLGHLVDTHLFGSELLNAPKVRDPTKVEREVERTSTDFIELMGYAHDKITQVIVTGRSTGDPYFTCQDFGSRLFWSDQFSGLGFLATAADRLVQLADSLGTKPPKTQRGETTADALIHLCEMRKDERYADRCLEVADDLRLAIRARNELVHKVGTPMGRMRVEHYDSLMRRKPSDHVPADWGLVLPPDGSSKELENKERDEIITRLVKGYRALIEFGNFVLFLAVRTKQG